MRALRKIVSPRRMSTVGGHIAIASLAVAAWIASALSIQAAGRQVAIPPVQGAEFLGAAACNSSGCHGGAGEKRSQYITWTQQDFHSRAYAVLLNARSARMAETLRLGSAQTSARCTVCHSPFQSTGPARLTKTARPDEGVSCESCHNAAADWLRSHTRPDWNYAMRVTAGMRDLRSFYVRANTCVACHQNLEPDVLAAGHPELRFELDGQSVAEPKHWRDPPGTGANAWLVGQAVALREMSWALANSPDSHNPSVQKWNALVWLLGWATEQQSSVPVLAAAATIPTRAVFIDTQQRADAIGRAAAQATLGEEFARSAWQRLAGLDSAFNDSKETSETLFCRAERLVPALNRLAVAAGLDSDAAPRPETRALLDSVQPGSAFDGNAFAKALHTYRDTLVGAGQPAR